VAHILVDAQDAPIAMGRTWRLYDGYARSHTGGRHARAVLLHRLILGLDHFDPREGDHRDGDRLNNRRDNLRIVPKLGNRQNRATWARSGVRGVKWCADRQKWSAQAEVDGKRYWLGRHLTLDAAAEAVRAFSVKNMPFYIDRPAVGHPASQGA
jgi:hypothetical protein